jgi:hypothetical protein
MSETSELTGPLISALRDAGAWPIRMQSGRVRVRGGWMMLAPAGTADILCFPQRKPITWIETKTLAGELRGKQEEFRERVVGWGHRYIVARSIDEGLEALR